MKAAGAPAFYLKRYPIQKDETELSAFADLIDIKVNEPAGRSPRHL
jgi:hypothetical protein